MKTTITILAACTVGIFSIVSDFQQTCPQPVEIAQEDPKLTEVKKTLTLLGRDVKFAKDILITAQAKNIDPVLWTVNFELESNMKREAVSPKGYKSFGQTRVAFQKMGYDTADMMAAACDLEQKRKAAKGDEFLAWCYYKGGDNPMARGIVKEMFAKYRKVVKEVRA